MTRERVLTRYHGNSGRAKNYLLRIAHELNVPLTVRRVPGGVIFWRSSEEDLQQAQETASRLQTAQRNRRTRPSQRRRT